MDITQMSEQTLDKDPNEWSRGIIFGVQIELDLWHLKGLRNGIRAMMQKIGMRVQSWFLMTEWEISKKGAQPKHQHHNKQKEHHKFLEPISKHMK